MSNFFLLLRVVATRYPLHDKSSLNVCKNVATELLPAVAMKSLERFRQKIIGYWKFL